MRELIKRAVNRSLSLVGYGLYRINRTDSPRVSRPKDRVVEQAPRHRAPPAPDGFDPKSFFETVHWYHIWEIFDGIFTPGIASVAENCDRLGLPTDLSGRRVLDLGANNGCISFECERRGAAEVIGLEPYGDETRGFERIRDTIGSTKTRFMIGSVYELDPEVLGYFDVVIFSGVLYHLRYPLLAIDNIRRVATADVFVETHISDNELIPPVRHLPLWKFYRLNELNNDYSNWFGPNIAAVIEAFESAGFRTRLSAVAGNRATFQAVVKEGIPEFLSIASHERNSYDVLMGHLLGRRKTDS
jgi:tRNA (mo5U34)-methyltransferase